MNRERDHVDELAGRARIGRAPVASDSAVAYLGAAGGVPFPSGEQAHGDWKVNGSYADTPKKGVVGIPFLEKFVEQSSLKFLEDAAKHEQPLGFGIEHAASNGMEPAAGRRTCRMISAKGPIHR